MEQHCRVILKSLNVIHERSYHFAQIRTKRIPLDRTVHTSKAVPSFEERALEMAIWRSQRLDVLGSTTLIPGVSRGIISYQVPIRQTDKAESGKAVDLLGINEAGEPVVFELRVGQSPETPLRMLVEALSYAVAMRKAWNESGALRRQVPELVRKLNPNVSLHDGPLLEVPIVGIAPTEYWDRCLGRSGAKGKVPQAAWPPFGDLVRACRVRGFPAYFVQFDVGGKDVNGLPTVSRFRVVDELKKYI